MDFSFGGDADTLDGGLHEYAIFYQGLCEANIKNITGRYLVRAVLAIDAAGKRTTG